MNSYGRKALKRANESKSNWKTKAIQRNKQLRAAKVKIRDLEKSRQMWRERYITEKEQSQLQALSSTTSPILSASPDPKFIHFVIISLCINLATDCSVSFRSVPKILSVFKKLIHVFGLSFDVKIPHFTTVIRWTLQVGKFFLAKVLKQSLETWICVIDHTIQVGKKKALVVLKVPIEAVKYPRALTLKAVEVLSIKVQSKWNGTIVQHVLEELFSTVGYPLQVVIDGGPDLNKGLRNILAHLQRPFKLTYDITHFIATLLKRKYKDHTLFTTMLSQLAKTKSKILQTSLAYLSPLKERSKSRFLNLPAIAKWTKQIITYMNLLLNPSEKEWEEREYVMSTFSWIFDYHEFLKSFWTEIQALTEIQKIVKNTGLNEVSYKKVCKFLQTITDPNLQVPFAEYLQSEFEFASNAPYPILLTSDVIESLFGKYKYLAKPHSMSEINRMILSLPCICEKITPDIVKEAFSNITNKEVEQWCCQEISETLLSKRRKAFPSHPHEKASDVKIIPFSNNDNQNDSIVTEYCGQKTAGTALVQIG